MSDKVLCEQCGVKHLPEYQCDVKIYQAWSRRCDRLTAERDALAKEVQELCKENERFRNVLDKISSVPECDGEAEYYSWGNYDDAYSYGVERGEWLQALKAKAALQGDAK